MASSHVKINRLLLKACSINDLELLNTLIHDNPNILTSETPIGNNSLHLAAMLGYRELAKEVWSRDPSLFSSTNEAGETPLVLALASANNTLASDMIAAATQLLQPDSTHGMEGGKPLHEMLLKYDIRGDNVLHHAMRNGFEDLAVQLLDIEPRLSEQVNKSKESPMHMAARRGYAMALERLINIPSAATSGPGKCTALHAAVDAGRTDICKQLLEGLPELANEKTCIGYTPLGAAACVGNLELVKIFLRHDPNLAYIKNNNGRNPFLMAAAYGFVAIAEEIFRVCPDSAYDITSEYGSNALHIAISRGKRDFVEYILRNPKLHRLIHQGNVDGDLPLHIAARECNPEILRLLLNYKRQDSTALNANNSNAVDIVSKMTSLCKTLQCNESYTLVSSLIPSAWNHSAIDEAKMKIKTHAIEEIKSLTERYTSNTSPVAALLATITFAAAFTLPGGYSSDTSNAGLPIFGMKAAFQVFLISDTIAMCSALAVAFLCIDLATWEDLNFQLTYRSTARDLMRCAYVTTAVAFGTGLFTVMAPKCMWLAIFILVLSIILPFVSKIIRDWPLLMLRFRLGPLYRKDLEPYI